MKSKKAPGFDQITDEILKQLRNLYLVWSCLRTFSIQLSEIPAIWKVAEVIMLPKPDKPPNHIKL